MQGNTASASIALGDRANKVANSLSVPTAVYQHQPKGSTFGQQRGCQASLPSGYAVLEGVRTDENRDKGISHDACMRDRQQYNVNTHADAGAQVHVPSMSGSCTSVGHEAEVDTESDTITQCLSLPDNMEAAKNSAQKARLSHSFGKTPWQHGGVEPEQTVFIAANSGSTGSAIEAMTISPGRRVFAAHVTVTRPSTPASPA